jgi:PIN domain nuclease of toxin-antitoxin system
VIRFVIDSSALLALLRNERGGTTVAPLLADSAMCTVNLSEVVAHYARTGSSEADIRSLLTGLGFESVPLDDDLAYTAGMLIPLTRSAGLSFGDRACVALALRLGAKVITADRVWSRIADAVGVEIELIR